jgi:hypothetical protein
MLRGDADHDDDDLHARVTCCISFYRIIQDYTFYREFNQSLSLLWQDILSDCVYCKRSYL